MAPDFKLAQSVAPEVGEIHIHVLSYMGERSPESASGLTKLRANLKCEGAYWVRAPNQQVAAVLPFAITLFSAGDKDVEIGRVYLQYQVVYTMRRELSTWSDDELQAFAAYYGTNHVWPYARSDAQAITAKIGLPVLTLPIMKIGELPGGLTMQPLSPDTKPGSADTAVGSA